MHRLWSRWHFRSLTSAVWIASVVWHWHGNVPLAATKIARLTPAAMASVLTPGGELLLLQRRWQNGPGSPVVRCGPIEYWTFPECRKVREFLTAADVIIDGPAPRTWEMLVRRNGRLLLVDAEVGQVLMPLPDIPDACRFALSPGRKEILIADNKDTVCIDLRSAATRWRIEDCSFEREATSELFLAIPRSQFQSGSFRADRRVHRLATGEPDPRFDHLGAISSLTLSANGELAIVNARPAPPGGGSPATVNRFGGQPRVTTVCRVSTGESLWTVPATTFPAFSADDQEVHSHRVGKDRLLYPSRWRAVDGDRLPDFEPGDPSPLIQQSADGQFAFLHQQLEETPFKKLVIRAAHELGRHGVRIALAVTPPRTFLRETATGRNLGPLPMHASHQFLTRSNGLVSIDHQFLRYYALPPRRDYGWLARWALLPPLGIVLAGCLGRRALVKWKRARAQPAAQPPAIG